MQRGQGDYEDFLANAADAILVAAPGGKIVSANRRAEELLGFTAGELKAMTMGELLAAGDAAAEPFPRSDLQGRRPVFIERRMRRKAGGDIPVEMDAVVLPDGNLLGIVRDITPRKASEQMLRESEERYRQMFETNPAVKLVIDPDDGRIVDANPAACQFYGYPFEALTQMRIFDINQLGADEIRREMAAAATEHRLYFVFPHKIASGEVRWVEVYSGPLTLGGKTYLHSIVHDITDRRSAEDRLRESERYYRSLIENSSDVITIVDAGGIIRYESPSIERVSGFTPDEVVGRSVFDLMHADDAEAARAAFSLIRNSPGIHDTLELRLVRKDGGWSWIEATGTNLLEDPAVRGIVINSRDVTARRQAEDALRERTEELEKLNQFMVDRELRMVELKKELGDLQAELAALRKKEPPR